jgi:hypothetical protein
VAIDIVPVVFGRGKPYFGTLANGHLMLEDPEVVIQGGGLLHLRYPLHRGRSVVTIDHSLPEPWPLNRKEDRKRR